MVDQGSTDGTLDRLQQLVIRRPNIQLIQADANGQADWLQVCSGDYVLPISADRVLFPEALEVCTRSPRSTSSMWCPPGAFTLEFGRRCPAR